MQVNNKIVSIVAGLLVILFASCKEESTLTYKMKNIASDSVDVIHARVGGSAILDTIRIGYNQQVTIAVATEGTDHVSAYREKAARLRGFTRIDVYRNHSQKSTADFLETSRWTYREKGRHAADYEATVTDADF